MNLPNDLVTQFVLATKDEKIEDTERILYGTVIEHDKRTFVRIDGSDQLTPVTTVTNHKAGEKVIVSIKNHTAIITGNVSSPSASSGDVEELENKITEFDIVIADKVSTKELEAERARIDNLVSENIVVKEKLTANEAEINKLIAKDVIIEGDLSASKAEIEVLKTKKLDAEIADLKYATIEDLDVTNATIHNLEVTYGEFESLTTNKFEANEAAIKKLEAEKLSVTDADIKFANIDFSNIGKAAIEKLFSDSGLIKDLIVGDGTITGELVGVTIKGDLIEGNTIKADKLVVKGSDGLYYKLNINGETIESQQTEYNSLHGSIITAKSITATKISVNDLVAFDATIGGFNISNTSIYSGVKDSVSNTTKGIYLDRDGQIAIGDADNFLKYYKDQNGVYKLKISAGSITLGTNNKDLESMLGETITNSIEEFYQSVSPTSLSGGSWSRNQPEWTDGKYIWRRTVVTYGDGSILYTPSENGVCITGNTGIQGEDGKDSIFLQILSSNGNMFKNSNLSTTLTITIIVGENVITSSREMYKHFGSNARIEWKQKRFGEQNFTIIDATDTRLSDNGFILTLNPKDVYTQTVFNCELFY